MDNRIHHEFADNEPDVGDRLGCASLRLEPALNRPPGKARSDNFGGEIDLNSLITHRPVRFRCT
jgi:hypothetical protein